MMINRGSKRGVLTVLCNFAALATLLVCHGFVAAQTDTPDRFETVRAYIQAWLDETSADQFLLSSSDLNNAILAKWDAHKDMCQIVSLRQPDDYTKAGHIPHAINIPWTDITKDSNLAVLDINKNHVLYCYFGHASALSCTILNLLGYPCRSLNFGMMDWNTEAVVKQPWDREADYPLDSVAHEITESYRLPVIAVEESEPKNIIKILANNYLGGAGSPVIPSSEVKTIVDNWDSTKTEYQVIDARMENAYVAGHIPHAINIPWNRIAEIGNLKKLDPTRVSIVYTENGQTGQIAATILNLLGYRAVAFKFGLMDWNKSSVDPLMRWDGEAAYPVEMTK